MTEYKKQMVYSANRENPEIIAEGIYRDFHYYVLNLGTHPCAYIDVSNTKLDGINYDDIELKCHCGLTYSRPYLATVEKQGWFIGWDYAHYCDYAGYEMDYPGIQSYGKKWTTDEIINECKEAIDSLIVLLKRSDTE